LNALVFQCVDAWLPAVDIGNTVVREGLQHSLVSSAKGRQLVRQATHCSFNIFVAVRGKGLLQVAGDAEVLYDRTSLLAVAGSKSPEGRESAPTGGRGGPGASVTQVSAIAHDQDFGA